MKISARTFLSQARVFLLVSLLTLLVWMLAEAESLRVERLRAEITFRAEPETGRLVRVEPNQDFGGYVHIRVEGPTTNVDALAVRLRRALRLEPGMDGVPLEPGRHTVNLQEALRSHSSIRDTRVTITDVEPASVQVVIDNLVTRDLPVRVQVPPGQILDGAPEVSPTAVRIRMPEAIARQLPEGAQAIARPEPAAVAALPEGRRGSIQNVPVELPDELRGQDGVRILPPSQVTVALTPRSRTANHTIPTIPVHIRIPPAEAALWEILVPPEHNLLTDVPVSGPGDVIEQIQAGRIRPIAYITLTFEELERAAAAGQAVQVEISFSDLPTAIVFEPRQRTIPVTVRRRPPADSPSLPPSP
jgi:hypothetical protein